MGCVAAFVAALIWAWDFTVDDALISLRYAFNFSRGHGWAFNPGDRASDGVTPLPWPLLLAPLMALTGAAPFVQLIMAKFLGAVAVGLAVVVVLRELGRLRRLGPWSVLVVLPYAPVAWAVSGMETGLVTLLATLAVVKRAHWQGAVWAGLAVAFRPELLPWASVLIGASAWRSRRSRADVWSGIRRLGLVWLAPLLVVLVRLVAFGRPSPLALAAKPSDWQHGLVYLLASALSLGTPLLLLLPARRGARAVRVAAAVHALVLIAVGGDWMPYARLWVPVIPSLPLAFAAELPAWRSVRGLAARGLLVVAVGCALGIGWRAAPAGWHVGRERRRVTDALVGRLQFPVASLDVGYVSAAAGDAQVIDLGGLTDLEIAMLGGGQTSKRVDLAMLESRGMRSLVVWGERGSRVVEQRIVQSARFLQRYRSEHVGSLGGRPVVVWTRRGDTPP